MGILVAGRSVVVVVGAGVVVVELEALRGAKKLGGGGRMIPGTSGPGGTCVVLSFG